MIQLDIQPEDAAALREVLESARSELGYEIANTDKHDYRKKLKAKQQLLEKVIGQLDAAT